MQKSACQPPAIRLRIVLLEVYDWQSEPRATKITFDMKTFRKGLLVTGIILASYAPLRAELVYAVTVDQNLISFDSSSPSTILSASGLTGLGGGEVVRSMDFDASGNLYVLGSSSRLYAVNPATGIATPVGPGPFSPLLSGTTFGMSYNAANGQMHIVSDLDQSLRLNPVLGTVAGVDPVVAYAVGDVNFGLNPVISGLAISGNSFYAIDSTLNTLATLDPTTGGLTTRGPLGVDISRFNGFDISPFSGIGLLGSPATSGGLAADLWTMNLASGQLTLVGHIGDPGDNYLVQALAVVPEPSTTAMMALGGFAVLVYVWRRRA